MKNSKSKKASLGAIAEKKEAYVATATTQRSSRPTGKMSQYTRHITHRELVASVNGSTAFTATGYDLNPGIARTFPWLSTQATGWEQYRFNRLVFEFVTRTATSTLGSVILSPEYDPSDPPPTSEAIATNAMDAVEDATWKNITCRLNTASMYPLGPRKYIRSTRIGGDIRTFDSGTFFICTVEEAGADAIGKLWVEYDVDLYIPQTASSAASGSNTTFSNGNGTQTYTTTVAAIQSWAAPSVDACHLFSAATMTAFTPPAGAYIVSAQIQAKDTSAESFTVVATFRKNGGAVIESRSLATSVANGYVIVPVQAYLSANGSDTFDIYVTMTGAAGTLTSTSDSTLLVQLA